MSIQRSGFSLLTAFACLISLNSFASDRIAKEYTTPPPSDEALAISTIPPLLTPAPPATPTTTPSTSEAEPAKTSQ